MSDEIPTGLVVNLRGKMSDDSLNKERLRALEDAYFSGTKQVTHGDRTVTYRSLEELWEAIARLRDMMGLDDGVRRARVRVGVYNKGL